MWIGILIVVFAVALAFANGANGNSKGVATLIGGGLLPGRKAILYAGAATLLGSVAAIWFGVNLTTAFLVIIASRWGMPGELRQSLRNRPANEAGPFARHRFIYSGVDYDPSGRCGYRSDLLACF